MRSNYLLDAREMIFLDYSESPDKEMIIIPRMNPVSMSILTRDEWKEIRRGIESFYSSAEAKLIMQTEDQYFNEHFDRRHEGRRYDENCIHCRRLGRPIEGKSERKKMSGFVYVVTMRSPDRLYKIGKAIDFDVRYKALQNLCGGALSVTRLFSCDDALGLEKIIHERFKDKRERGEWFRLMVDDFPLINAIAEDNGAERLQSHGE